MEYISSGVTRHVFLTKKYALKAPKNFRGWLANESEWRQRRRPDVNRPLFSLLHFLVVFPRADGLPTWEPEECPIVDRYGGAYSLEEAKGSSWGLFGTSMKGYFVLIDYDRAWQHPRSFLGFFYYWNQERLARKWSKL